MASILKFTIYFLIFIKIQSQKCPNSSQFYDYINQTCIQCHQSCLTCIGGQIDQCLTCNQDHYLYKEENLCTKKCFSSDYQNESTKECIQCQILGCQQCKSSQKCIQCLDNFELKDDLCYLNENTCINQQFYDPFQNKCVYSCKENQVVNKTAKICQKIQECNSINQYSDSQVNLYGQIFVLSNLNVVFYQNLCYFQIADLNLQFIQSLKLLSDESIQNSFNLNKHFFQSGDMVACIGKEVIILYDFLKKEKNEIFPKLNQKLYMTNCKIFLESNIAMFDQVNNFTILDLLTAKYFTIEEKVVKYFQISVKYGMFALSIPLQQKVNLINYDFFLFLINCLQSQQTLLIEMEKKKGLIVNISLNESSEYSQILNDDLGIFYCDFLYVMRFYQIDKKDQTNINLLLEYSYQKKIDQQLILQYSNINFLNKLKLMLMIKEEEKEYNLQIFQVENNWESLNLKNKITFKSKSVKEKFVLHNRNNKSFLQMSLNDQICFIELNEQFLSKNEQSIYDKCIQHNNFKLSNYQLYTLINDNQIYFFFDVKGQIFLIQSDINHKDNQQDQFKTTEGYLTQMNYNFYNIIPIPQRIEQQELYYYFIFGTNSLPYLQQQYMHLYNYQYNKFQSQKQVNIIGLDVNDLSKLAYYQIMNNNEIILIFYEIKKSKQEQIMIYNLQTFKIILISNINYKELPQIIFRIQYIDKYQILIINGYNFLIDLKKQKILDFNENKIIDFNYPIQIIDILNRKQNIQFYYSSEIEDKLLVYEKKYIWVDLNTLEKSLPLKIEVYLTEFALITKNHIFFGDSFGIISFSLLEQKNVRKIQIEGINKKDRIIFRSNDNYLYLLYSDKIEKYSLELNLLETIKLEIQLNFVKRQRDQNVQKIEQRYIVFGDENNFYKFDIILNKWYILKIQNYSPAEYSFSSQIFFFGDKKQYVAYKNTIINFDQFKVIKKINDTTELLLLSQQKYDTSNIILFFFRSQQYLQTAFNVENLPFVEIEFCTKAELISSDIYNYIQYQFCVEEKIIQKINLLSKIKIEYKFDYKFDYKIDLIVKIPNSDIFIFTSNQNQLNAYDLQIDNSLKVIYKFYSFQEQITKIDICPIQKKIIIKMKKRSIPNDDYQLLFIKYNDKIEFKDESDYRHFFYGDMKYQIMCEENLIFWYNPYIASFNLDDGKKLAEGLYEWSWFTDTFCMAIFDQKNGFPLFAFHKDEIILIKENIKKKQTYFGCDQYTATYYDQKQQMIITLDKMNKQIRNFNIKNNQEKTNSFDITFEKNFVYFNEDNSKIIVLDSTFTLIKYNYIQNTFNKTQLPYGSISGFQLDLPRDVIFFYDDRQIYSHRFTDLQFLEAIMDEKYFNLKIIDVMIDKNLNVLTVHKENSIVLLYDVHEIIYFEDFFFKEKFEIDYLEFKDFHYIVYNIETISLSLFQKSQIKETIMVFPTDKKNLFNVGQLIKIGNDKLFYSNQDFIIFCKVNTIHSKLIKICEKYHQNIIKEIFYDSKQQLIIIIEQQSNNIYELDLIKAEQTKECRFNMLVNNFGENKYYYGVILNRNLIYYSDDKLYQYDLDQNKQLDVKQWTTGKISLIEKLNFNNNNINKRKENYLNNERVQNLNDNEKDKLILIIFKEAHKIITYDIEKRVIKNQVDVNYNILNIHVDVIRNLIFIVGNMGYTYIYFHNLELSNQIRNPCIHQTNILADEYYIYSFCQKQLDIYNRGTLDKIYPTIRSGLKSLHRIIFTQIKDIFILVQYKSLSVVKILQQQNNFNILFEIKKELLTVARWQTLVDQNFVKSIQIIAISLLDIVDYKIQLELQEICQLTFQQKNSNDLNNYLLKNINQYLIDSSQFFEQVSILHQNNSELYLPILYSNTTKNGVNIKYYSDKESNILIWKNEYIFYNDYIKQLEFNSVDLSIEGKEPININKHNNNIKKIILENIKFKNIQQPIILQNIEEIIFSNITFENIKINNLENIFIIGNCSQIIISNLNITNSYFEQNLFFILNSNIIKIQHTYFINSSIYSLYKIQKSQSLIIDQFKADDIDLHGYIIDEIQVESTKISNMKTYNLNGGVIIKQNGCNNLQVDNLFVINSKRLRIIEVEPLKNILVFQNFVLKIKNLQVEDCTDISLITLNIIYDNVEIEDSSFNNIERPYYLLLMNLQTYKLNLNNITFNKISSNFTSSILEITNFNQINIENSIFQQNQLQLIRIQNQNINPQANLNFNNVTINNNSCLASLIKIKNTKSLSFENSTFLGNIQNNRQGSTLYLEDIEMTIIKNSTFISNTNQKGDGGSLYYKYSINDELLMNGLLIICERSKFLYNNAQSGKGGAIFLSNTNLKMKNSTIQQNSAAIGGGIYYEILIPDTIKDQNINILNEINDNKSIFYGNNVGSTLRQISFQPENILNNDYIFIQNNQKNKIQIINFQSGSYIQLNNIQFIDEEGNSLKFVKIQNDLTEDIKKEIENLSISIQNQDNNQQSNVNQIALKGELMQKYSDKGFNFNISLSFQLNKQSSFFLTSNSIQKLKYLNENDLLKEQSVQLKLKFLVNFRICKLGEVKKTILDNTICEKCPKGKYSLNLEDTQCQICLPESTIDCEGDQITLKQGFWRKSNLTDVIIPCKNNQFSCSPENSKTIDGCREGYIGPLCETCDYGGNVWNQRYSSRLKPFQCAQCSSNSFLILLYGIIFYLIIFLQIQYAITNIIKQLQSYLCSYYLKLAGILFLSKSGKSFFKFIFAQFIIKLKKNHNFLHYYPFKYKKIFEVI